MIHIITNQTLLLPNDIQEELQVCLTSTIEDVVTWCAGRSSIGVDTETTPIVTLEEKTKLLLIQIGDFDDQFVIDATCNTLEPLRGILESREIQKVLHNAKFDYKVLIGNTGITMEHVYDTMLADMILHGGNQEYYSSLKGLVQENFGVELDKSVRTTFQYGSFSLEQLIYAANDVKYLLPLRDKQLEQASALALTSTIELDNYDILGLADMELQGIALDKTAWLKVADEVKVEIDALHSKLDEIIYTDPRFAEFVPPNIQGDLFLGLDQMRRINTNWNSPKQVLAIMQKISPKLDSVNATVIEPLKHLHPIISTYIGYKEKQKLYQSYGPAMFRFIEDDGKIHTQFDPLKDTGRISSLKPNLQNIPHENRYRNCFVPGDPDWVWVAGDYSGQELALIAWDSQDPVWIDALLHDQDLHSICAELLYGSEWKSAALPDCAYYKGEYAEGNVLVGYAKQKCSCPRHKRMRTAAKSINFGLSYGMTERKLADKLQIPVPEAKRLIERFFSAFPSIKRSLDKSASIGLHTGKIRTLPPFHRIRFFPEWTPEMLNPSESHHYFKAIGDIERKSKNTHIQGSGANLTKLALIKSRRWLRDNPIPAKLNLQVHDELDSICHRDVSMIWAAKLKEIMEEAALEIIPNGMLKAEVTITDCWNK